MKQVLLTTVDNKISPFDNFDAWFSYDVLNNYNCLETLALMLPEGMDNLSDEEQFLITEEAINRIIEADFLNIYKKVYNFEEKEDEKQENS